MDYYPEIVRGLLFRSIQKETRLSERQVAALEWGQISGNVIRTKYGREAKISRELQSALDALPRKGRFVFMSTALPPAFPQMSRADERAERRADRGHTLKLPRLKIQWS